MRLCALLACVALTLGAVPYTLPHPIPRLLGEIRDKPLGTNQVWYAAYYRSTDTLYTSKRSKAICDLDSPMETACETTMNSGVAALGRMRWKTTDGRLIHVARCEVGPWMYLICRPPA